jgi:hypothetical protein
VKLRLMFVIQRDGFAYMFWIEMVGVALSTTPTVISFLYLVLWPASPFCSLDRFA